MKLAVKWGLALFFLVLVFYVTDVRYIYGLLDKLTIGNMTILVFVTVLVRLVYSEMQRIATNALNHSLGFFESFMLIWVRGYLNQFLPAAGMGGVAVYLKRVKGIPYAHYLTGHFYISYAQFISGGALLTLICLHRLMFSFDEGLLLLLMFSVTMMLVPILLLFIGEKYKTLLPSSIQEKLTRVNDALALLSQDRIRFKLIAINLLPYLIRGVRLWVICVILGLDVGLYTAVCISVVADLATVVSFTPAALGVRELVFGTVSIVFGLTFDDMVAAALVDRAAMLITIIVFGQISLIYLTNRNKGT